MPRRFQAIVAILGLLVAFSATGPAAGTASRARTLEVPILMYHRIDVLRASLPPMTRALTVDPDAFAKQMSLLHAQGFHAITQAQLLAALEQGAPLPLRPVMITFDDGYRDVLWNAAPTLARLGMPATEYVITGRISGPDPSFLTWPELHALEAHGIEIGSHTVRHAALPLLSSTAARHELVNSRRALERHLGHPVLWFAYPYGAEDARVVPLVREAGYALAVTTQSGTMQSSTAPLELHRYEVLDTTTAADLLALLIGS